jgi:hypothetical protein
MPYTFYMHNIGYYHEKNLKIHLNYKYRMLKLNQGL